MFTYFVALQFLFYSFTRTSKFYLLITVKRTFTRMAHLFASMTTRKLFRTLIFATTEEVLLTYISCGYFSTFHIQACDLAVTFYSKHLNTRRTFSRMTRQNTGVRTSHWPCFRAPFFTLKAFGAGLVFASAGTNFSYFVAFFHTCMILTI